MKTEEFILSPREAFDSSLFKQITEEKFHLPADGSQVFRLRKRSIDARGRNVVVRISGEIVSREIANRISYSKDYRDVSSSRQAIVVGAGPAGLFAGIRLIEAGIKPVILERGKDVQARRRDLAAINKDHIVNPESNYCFGEGGAGTYSDGKLYTRSSKRGDVNRILEILVAHGAPPEILYDAHPHIGTNKLPRVVQQLRESILCTGGEIRFDAKVIDIKVDKARALGVSTADGNFISGLGVILATGHSARDIFALLHRRKIHLEAKPFALGLRVEHPQDLIDRIQYHCPTVRDPFLPASSYSLVHQVNRKKGSRGVFSFCMCPGGFIVPSATAPGEVVVNGMSPSRRDSKYANSGIVMSIEPEDYGEFEEYGPLAGMHFQQKIEQKACRVAGGGQWAPAQRLVDFVEKKISSSLPDTSYQPGLVSCDIASVLPAFVADGLRQGFRNFGDKMNGYLTNDAQVVGVESRTSSPVRIPRDRETLEHPQVQGLFPCGEGAGFAGGIVSAAMDGERCAEALLKSKRA